MTIREVIIKYLRENGFDGLAGEDCGCALDDLAPCSWDCNLFDCQPAYKVMCDGNPKRDEDGEPDHDCPGHEHEMFTTEKPEKKP